MANWMQNVVNNIQESQNKAGEFLNGIITDKKTEYIDHRTAIVPGVYAGNSVYRKQALEHIWGVYNMLPDVLTQSMGKLFEIATESMLPPKNMKSLLDYTHDGASVYSTNIRSKYINLKDKKVENLSTVSKSSYMPWYFTDDDNLVGANYAEYWNIGTPSNVFEHRRTSKEIERDARKAEKKAKKDARKQVREEKQEERIERIEGKNSKRAERVEDRINKRRTKKESKNKPNEPTNTLNFYDGSYRDMYYEDFLYETIETGIVNEEGDFEDEKIPVDFVLRSRLLRKTSELFDKGKIHYDEQIYGNLLEKTGGYVDSLGGGQDRGRGKSLKDRDGKFFRSWSHAKRYSLLGDSMRNGKTKSEIDTAIISKVKTQPNRDSLILNTVLQSNGLIKISPTKEDNANGLYANLKKCMFSIENLALLDAHHVQYKERDGQGVEYDYYRDMKAKRIMWFPPYDLKFSDNSNVQWNETNFIGRGEPIYTYANTKRSGTLSFTMLIDHPSIIHNFKNGHFNDSKLLKFFNGDVKSDDFEEKTFNVSTYRYEVKEKNSGDGEPQEAVDIDGPCSCFSVYFPYGYSGYFYSKDKADETTIDWLYEGVGKATNDDIICKNQGYEMNEGTGISKRELHNLDEINIKKIEKGKWKQNGYKRYGAGRTFRITIARNDKEYTYTTDVRLLHKYFGYVSCTINNIDINKNGSVTIKVGYIANGTKRTATIPLEKKYILERVCFSDTSGCYYIPGKDDYDGKGLYMIDKYDSFIRFDEHLEESMCTNSTNSSVFNYEKTTERNVSQCKDIDDITERDDVEKLSFKDVYDLFNNNEAQKEQVESSNPTEDEKSEYEKIRDGIVIDGKPIKDYSDEEIQSKVSEKNDKLNDLNERHDPEDEKNDLSYYIKKCQEEIRHLENEQEYRKKNGEKKTKSEDITEKNGDTTPKKLKNALNGETDIEKIIVKGVYTGTDGNVQNTCKRRCEIIKTWLKQYFSNATIETSYAYAGQEPKIDSIHTGDAVKNRRVDVYVMYKGSEILSPQGETELPKEEEKPTEGMKKSIYETEEGFSVYNEAEYFSTLSETNNIAYNEIKDKIKNFNPAFHSITPEGFAMRLNFLHGCTRQGKTLEGPNSDKVATNLAFGRPPVCVLRIGDFIHTKMIIRTLSINYETGSGIQWDLNPEGVGIQPMFAKVQMGIDLIGGQSLEEPVRQLNNALNGLHYANSGIINGKKK